MKIGENWPKMKNGYKSVGANCRIVQDQCHCNLSRLKCSKRVKYEEWRIVWGRQELNRYKDKYVLLKSGNSVACSYC